jgi:hypothetical protein
MYKICTLVGFELQKLIPTTSTNLDLSVILLMEKSLILFDRFPVKNSFIGENLQFYWPISQLSRFYREILQLHSVLFLVLYLCSYNQSLATMMPIMW